MYSVETIDLDARKQKLIQSVAEIGVDLLQQDRSKLHSLLWEHHDVFVLEEGEQGETALIQMQIDTGDAMLKRQPVRRTPFAATVYTDHSVVKAVLETPNPSAKHARW